jgi:hypothetical protein
LPDKIANYLDLDAYGDKYYFIIDEYYEMLKSASIVADGSGNLPGIFSVGKVHNVIISTGHYSK